MKCEILRGQRVILGMQVYDQATVKRVIAKHGGDANVAPVTFSRKFSTGSITVYPVLETSDQVKPGQMRGTATRTVNEDDITYHYSVRDKTAEELATDAQRILRDLHAEYENGKALYDGVYVATDLEARINVTGLVEGFMAGVYTAQEWRGKTAPVEGDNAVIDITSTEEAQALKMAIVSYVGKGFAVRTALEKQIKALAAESDSAGLLALDVRQAFNDALEA